MITGGSVLTPRQARLFLLIFISLICFLCPIDSGLQVFTEEQQQQIATEANLLRKTLLELLLENQALRTALNGNQYLGLPDIQPSQQQPRQALSCVPTSMGIPPKFDAEKRRLAVERYRLKRKRRLQQPMASNARYVKMKAVADGKQRNACGKFVKS